MFLHKSLCHSSNLFCKSSSLVLANPEISDALWFWKSNSNVTLQGILELQKNWRIGPRPG